MSVVIMNNFTGYVVYPGLVHIDVMTYWCNAFDLYVIIVYPLQFIGFTNLESDYPYSDSTKIMMIILKYL